MSLAPSTNPRVLLSTAYRGGLRDFYDPSGANFVHRPHFALPRTVSPALRFLKQNIPEIEILEFPLWRQYVDKLAQGWDVVGFSFFHHDLDKVREMAREARRRGVKTIIAGGYGALCAETGEFADRIYKGYAEDQLCWELFGRRPERLLHPPLAMSFELNLPPSIPLKKVGYLFTQRGCPYRCSFCQAQAHAPVPTRIPLESIRQVLLRYREDGINEVWVFDETFYLFPSHSEAVIDMLNDMGFYWWVQTRMDLAMEHMDDWADRGMTVLGVGLESVNDDVLRSIGKRIDLDLITQFRQRAARRQVGAMAYCMIGYEQDSAASIIRDYHRLRKLAFDLYQLTVITPFPQTPQWDDLARRYGIFENNPANFDARHLVWNHPSLTPRQVEALLELGMSALNVPWGHYGRGMIRLANRRFSDKGLRFLWEELFRPPIHALRFKERRQHFFTRN